MIPSKPAEDDSLVLAIILEVPCTEKMTAGIAGIDGTRRVGKSAWDSSVNTEEKGANKCVSSAPVRQDFTLLIQ